MKCLYCDTKRKHYSLYDLFIENDCLCDKCRFNMPLQLKYFKLEELECLSLYEYDSLFKTILLQYKECYDEALAITFLYKIDLFIKLKYLGYKVVYVPSSYEKYKQRGFNHLKLIFKSLNFKEVSGLIMKKDLIQQGKSLSERKQMLDNYYYEGDYINKLLIIDDICTTGSSLLGVYKAFVGKANIIKALVLAKA